MAPPLRTPRSRWIEQALKALAAGGPEAVRVEALATTLGVSKGGFYGHFADRGALLEALLDTWEQTMIDEVIARVEGEGGDARARLRHLFALASSVEARDLLAVDLAIREWARRDAGVARRLRRVDGRRMAYMRSLFSSLCPDEDVVEARCLMAFSLFVGSHFVAVGHRGRRRSEVMELALRELEAGPGAA